MATNPNGINGINWPLVGSGTTTTTDLKKDTSPNMNDLHDKSTNGISHLTNNHSTELADANNSHSFSANATNVGAHLATPTQTVPYHNNKYFDYKLQMNEINDAINMMMQSWPTVKPMTLTSCQHVLCHQNTTTYFQTPDDHYLSVAAIASFSTAAHPASTPIVQQREEITTEFPCQLTAFLETQVHAKTMPMTADETTEADTGNKLVQQSLLALVTDPLYCTPINFSAYLTVSGKEVHGSYPRTPPPNPSTDTTLDNPTLTMTTIIPTSTLVFANAGVNNDAIHTSSTPKIVVFNAAVDEKPWFQTSAISEMLTSESMGAISRALTTSNSSPEHATIDQSTT